MPHWVQGTGVYQRQARMYAIDQFLPGGREFHFVDLPGYGFAQVPKEITTQWKELIEQYLLAAKLIAVVFLILDARRGWMEKDLELKQWLEFHNRRYLVVATKTDKLKTQNDQRRGIAAIRSHLQRPSLCRSRL